MMLNSMALAPGQFPLQLTKCHCFRRSSKHYLMENFEKSGFWMHSLDKAMVDAVLIVKLSPNEKPLGACGFCPYDL